MNFMLGEVLSTFQPVLRTAGEKFISSLMILFSCSLMAICQASVSEEDGSRLVTVTRFEHPPVIDGKLDENQWRQASRLTDFYQAEPGENIKPSFPTEVLLAYDNKWIYIGIHAFDEPSQVRATVAKRDDLSGNDYTAVWLDTFNDNRRAYILCFNPLGIQADAVFTEGQSVDFSVDLVMHSKGTITADGYVVEIAVPFSSLRYEVGKGKRWGVHVVRRVRHLDEWNSWMPLKRETHDFPNWVYTRFMDQAGRITGIENVSSERTLELIPTLTIAEMGRRVRTLPRSLTGANPALIDNGRFVNEPIKLDLGLTAKLTLTSGATIDAAINPDFAQVEADQLVVTANQRFPIFFAEKRPFFLEGIEIFQTPIKTVHTRTIIDPDVALKLAGRHGRNTFGLMFASDNAPGNFSEDELDDPITRPQIERFIDKNAVIGVLRIKHDVGKESHIGLIATTYNFIEKHNHVFGIDGRFTLNPETLFTFQTIGTNTRRFFFEPELDKTVYRTGNGFAYYTQLQHNRPHLQLSITGDGRTLDYRAEVGFTTQTNINKWSASSQYNSQPKTDATLISWSLGNTITSWFDWQGRMKYAYVYPRMLLNFKRQTSLNFYAYGDYLRLLEEEFGAKRTATQRGAFFGPPERSTFYGGFTVQAATQPSKRYYVSILVDRSWKNFDYDFGAGPKFPRVSPAALQNPNAPLDPGTGTTLDIDALLDWRPIDAAVFSVNYIKSRLVRDATKRVAYDQNLYSLRATYQFTPFTFARARVDYDTLKSRVFGQFLFGWSPNPGTALYAGYNEDLNQNGFNPFTGQHEPGLRRNGRTFFIKLSYLFRRSL